MHLQPSRLVPWLALASAPVLIHAAATRAVDCDCTGCFLEVLDGTVDDFVGPEPTTPRPELLDLCGPPRQDFDEFLGDRCFVHTIELSSPCPIFGATLELHLRPVPGGFGPENDRINLQLTGDPSPAFEWSSFLGTSPGQDPGLIEFEWDDGSVESLVFTIDLDALPLVGGGTTSLIDDLNEDGVLDIRIADDTNVDYIRLTLVYCDTTDCDGNGLFDQCEIEADPDLDCNGDGILDACQCNLAPVGAVGVIEGSTAGTPQSMYVRTLSLKRFFFRGKAVGDAVGKGDVAFAWAIRPLFSTLPFDLEANSHPTSGILKVERAKRKCKKAYDGVSAYDVDCNHAPDGPKCNWFESGLQLYRDEALGADFANPMEFEMQFTDVDIKWTKFAKLIVPVILDLYECIEDFPDGCEDFEQSLTELLDQIEQTSYDDADCITDPKPIGDLILDGVVGTELTSPEPAGQITRACRNDRISNTRGSRVARAETTWLVGRHGQGVSGTNPPFGPGTADEIAYFEIGQVNEELAIRIDVAGGNLSDPTAFVGQRGFYVPLDVDADQTTGDPTVPFCGADHLVEVLQSSDGSSISMSSALYRWTCACSTEGFFDGWVLQEETTATPWADEAYGVFVGIERVRARVALSAVGDPQGAIAVWALSLVNGIVETTVPSDPCTSPLSIARTPDQICPRVSAFDSLDALDGDPTAPVTITFSEPIEPPTAADVLIDPPVAVTLDLDPTGQELRITPVDAWPSGFAVLELAGSITDRAGNGLDAAGDGERCGTPFFVDLCFPSYGFEVVDALGVPVLEYPSPTSIVRVRGSGLPDGTFECFVVPEEDAGAIGRRLVDQTVDGSDVVTIAGGELAPTGLGPAIRPDHYAIVLDLDHDGSVSAGDATIGRCEPGFIMPGFCEEIDDDLLTWYALDEAPQGASADPMDGLHLRHVGDPSIVAGVLGFALELDGAGDWLEADRTDGPTIEDGDLTIEGWFRTGDVTLSQPLVSKRRVTGGAQGFLMSLVADLGDPRLPQQLSLIIADGSSTQTIGPAGPDVADGAWHHLAAVVDRSDDGMARLYVDGVEVLAEPVTVLGDLDNERPLRLGADSSASPLVFDGSIDDVGIYDAPLPPDRILELADPRLTGKCLDFNEVDPCPSDLSGDGMVDTVDLLAVLAAWGTCPVGEPCPEDLDGNGAVDTVDLLELLGDWGPCAK